MNKMFFFAICFVCLLSITSWLSSAILLNTVIHLENQLEFHQNEIPASSTPSGSPTPENIYNYDFIEPVQPGYEWAVKEEDDIYDDSIAAILARQKQPTAYEREFAKKLRASYPPAVLEHGVNLRGLYCEIRDGREVCFLNHVSGRDECPSYVNSTYLSESIERPNCNKPSHYCIALCQNGTQSVHWDIYDTAWCEESGACLSKPETIPARKYTPREWSKAPRDRSHCENLPYSTFDDTPPFTIGILARGGEWESLRYSLKSYTNGFLQYVPEAIIFINEVSDGILNMIEPYRHPPYNLKVLSSDRNHGITEPISWLVGNASNEYFMFLEKDFRLIESAPCALKEISAAIKLMEEGKIHVYHGRSRYLPGKANWPDVVFRGKEETVWGRQPNILCSFYHWFNDPVKAYPAYFNVCSEDPLLYCSDSFYCAWTNNPQLYTKTWWKKNYFDKWKEISSPPKGFELEHWMNREPQAWNERKWVVAQGDGMFSHMDVGRLYV